MFKPTTFRTAQACCRRPASLKNKGSTPIYRDQIRTIAHLLNFFAIFNFLKRPFRFQTAMRLNLGLCTEEVLIFFSADESITV